MRQLVILCDGTNNNLTGGANDTHVVSLAELLNHNPDADRMMFYDPGVGNPGELPGTTWVDTTKRWLDRVAGLAFGRGVYENIAQCYLFLMREYRPGDQIFIFGFSRGSFTARSVGGLVNLFGILQPQMESLLPTLLHTYFADLESDASRRLIAEQVTRLFATDASQRAVIHFMGVWDTVATVGVPPFAARFSAVPTLKGKYFVHVRQALALDELRAQFKPRLYAENNGPFINAVGNTGTLTQLWFRGAHCDVGGGYTLHEAGLSQTSLHWLVFEAIDCGLRLQPSGRMLTSEQEVAEVFTVMLPQASFTSLSTQCIHSELRTTPLWAVTGMAVRDPNHIDIDGKAPRAVKAVEHPSVAAWPATFPGDTVWRRTSSLGSATLKWTCIMVFLFLTLGQLLQGFNDGTSWLSIIQTALTDIPSYVQANIEFQRWQLTAFLPSNWQAAHINFMAPRWAVVWDLFLIISYVALLAPLAARAFSRCAGLRRVNFKVPHGLNILGWALPILVGADLAEDVATWLAITLADNDVVILSWLMRLVMALCSATKLVGLIATLYLIVGAPGLAAAKQSDESGSKVAPE